MPMIIASAVIRIGPQADAAGLDHRRAARPTSSRARRSLAKLTTRIEFDTEMPIDMIAPISDSTLIVVPVSASIQMMPDQRAGHRHHDDERIDPGLEQDHQQRVDQDHRQDHAQRQAA